MTARTVVLARLTAVRIGITTFCLDDTIHPVELARAVEERGLRIAVAPRAQPHPDVARDRRGRAA